MAFNGGAAPQPTDTIEVAAIRALLAANIINGGPVPFPSFYPEGSKPLNGDTLQKTMQKINGALYAMSGGGSGGKAIEAYSGTGNPNGVVTATAVPAVYFQTDAGNTIWSKTSNAGTNTGWV
jgi:hypothetical protein